MKGDALSTSSDCGKHLKVYHNGKSPLEYEVIDLSLEQVSDWSKLILKLNRTVNSQKHISKIFDLNGRVLSSAKEVFNHDEIVLGSRDEPFKVLPYGQLGSGKGMSHSLMRESNGTKVDRISRATLAKSAVFADNGDLEESLKTYPNETVSHTDIRSLNSPKLRVRQNVSTRPRPVSSLTVSCSVKKPSPGVSRIPKRITPNSNGNSIKECNGNSSGDATTPVSRGTNNHTKQRCTVNIDKMKQGKRPKVIMNL